MYVDGLVQDCSNSSVLAMELLQYCTKPLISWYNNLNSSKYIKHILCMLYFDAVVEFDLSHY